MVYEVRPCVKLRADLQALLTAVGLEYLLTRSDGLDAKEEWADALSLGEQQRLGPYGLLGNSTCRHSRWHDGTPCVFLLLQRLRVCSIIRHGMRSWTKAQARWMLCLKSV